MRHCAGVCPVGAISPNGGVYVIDPGACIDCGTCEALARSARSAPSNPVHRKAAVLIARRLFIGSYPYHSRGISGRIGEAPYANRLSRRQPYRRLRRRRACMLGRSACAESRHAFLNRGICGDWRLGHARAIFLRRDARAARCGSPSGRQQRHSFFRRAA
jgi:ferredoxin